MDASLPTKRLTPESQSHQNPSNLCSSPPNDLFTTIATLPARPPPHIATTSVTSAAHHPTITRDLLLRAATIPPNHFHGSYPQSTKFNIHNLDLQSQHHQCFQENLRDPFSHCLFASLHQCSIVLSPLLFCFVFSIFVLFSSVLSATSPLVLSKSIFVSCLHIKNAYTA